MGKQPLSWERAPKAVAKGLLLVVLAPLLFVVLLVTAVIAPIVIGVDRWRAGSLRRRFEAKWRRHGKVGLLVYSNSPNWQAHIETRWLPHVADRLVVLNWSERKQWKVSAPLEARIHSHWAGDRNFNPVAIVFPDKGNVAVVRFWQPFRDYRHGKTATLRAAETELASLLGDQTWLAPDPN